MSEAANPSDRKPGTEKVAVELACDMLDAMDAFAATQRDAPSRAEAVRRILREWLSAEGYMRSPGGIGCTKPEDLNSANDD